MPSPFNGNKSDPTAKWVVDLIDSLNLLRCEISRSIDERKAQSEWLKSHFGCVTVPDLKLLERRILQAFQEHLAADAQEMLNGLLRESERITKRLERIDARTN